MKFRGLNCLRGRGHFLVIALGVCLNGCSTVPKQPASKDASGFYATPLAPEAEKRAQAVAHYATGLLYQPQGKGEEALAEFEQAAQLDPSNEELAVNVASEFLRRKQNDKGIEILEKAAIHSPDSVSVLTLLGYAYRMGNQLDKAAVAFQRVVKLSPAESTGYQNLVSIYILQNNRRQALKLLNEAARQKSADPRFWAALGEMYAAAVYEEEKPTAEPAPDSPKEPSTKERSPKPKQKPAPKDKSPDKVNPLVGFARALDCYEKAATLAPEDDKILSRLADLYVFNKLYDKAVPIYLKILELRPNSVNVREKLALSYVAQDDKKKAIAQIEEIVKKEPLKFKYYIMLGELYLDASRGEKDEKPKAGEETERQKLLTKSLDKFQQAVLLNPNEIEPQITIAYIQLLLKKPDQAIVTLDKAKEKFPLNPKLFYFYGLSYSDSKQYDKAVLAFAEMIKMVDESTESLLDSAFYFYYGAACERAGQIESAAEQFRKSIELNPENPEAYNYLGYMWADKGIKLNEALDFIRKALEFEPENGAYVDSLGWVYFKLGNYDDALKELMRAATLMKEPDPEVYNHIAEVYMRLGKKKDAIEHWQKAVAADPTNKEFAEKLKQAQGSP